MEELKEEKVKLLRKIYDARESETKAFNIGNYYGTPARIAELIARDEEKYSWFKDEINIGEKTESLKEKLRCFLQYSWFKDEINIEEKIESLKEKLRCFLQDTIYFDKTKTDFLNHFYDFFKVKLCLPDKFCTQVKCYEDIVDQLKDLKDNTVDPIFQKHNEKLENTLSSCEQILGKVYNSGEQWQKDVVRSIDEDDCESWQKTLQEFENISQELSGTTKLSKNIDIKLPQDIDLTCLKEDIKDLYTKLAYKRCSLSDLKEVFYIFDKIKVKTP